MDIVINYLLTGIILALLIVLVIWLIKHDRRDKRTYEKDLIRSELKPEKQGGSKEIKS